MKSLCLLALPFSVLFCSCASKPSEEISTKQVMPPVVEPVPVASDGELIDLIGRINMAYWSARQPVSEPSTKEMVEEPEVIPAVEASEE